MADPADTLSIPTNPVLPAAGVPVPQRVPNLFRSGDPPNAATSPNQRSDQSIGIGVSDSEARKLMVGRGTSLSGEITSCDRLVIEGSVGANLQNCQHMTIADTGLFNGNATIDEVEVSGRFEGELTVRKRLLIRASGRVSGMITYGEIEIEAGGKISGAIQAPEGSKGSRTLAASLLHGTPNGPGNGDRAEHG